MFLPDFYVFANAMYYIHAYDLAYVFLYDLYKVRTKSKSAWYLYKQ